MRCTLEPTSCDEAFVEYVVEADCLDDVVATVTARVARLRAQIFAATRCVASAGIGRNCFQAKVASTSSKPNGLGWFGGVPRDAPVRSLPGVGRKTSAVLREELGAESVVQLLAVPRETLTQVSFCLPLHFTRIVLTI
jgi:DNA polymerase-4